MHAFAIANSADRTGVDLTVHAGGRVEVTVGERDRMATQVSPDHRRPFSTLDGLAMVLLLRLSLTSPTDS